MVDFSAPSTDASIDTIAGKAFATVGIFKAVEDHAEKRGPSRIKWILLNTGNKALVFSNSKISCFNKLNFTKFNRKKQIKPMI